MANIEHATLGNNATKMHGIVKQTVANAAALAALVITADDIAQKIVIRQLDTDQLWVPVSAVPTFKLLDTIETGSDGILSRVSNAVAIATLGAGLGFAAGTLSLSEVSNTSQGVLPAISAAVAVPLSNGGGTAAVWTALSGGGSPVGSSRTISTTAPLSGGGDLSANRTLTVAAVSNTSSGVVPQTNGTAGQALIATAGATTWSTNFQAQDLTTTGNIVQAATPATQGRIRAGTTWSVWGTSGGTDQPIITYDSAAAGRLQISGPSAPATTALIVFNASNLQLKVGTNYIVQMTTTVVNLGVSNFQFDPGNSIISITTGSGGGAVGNSLDVRAQNESGSTGVGGTLNCYGGDATGAGGTGGDHISRAGDATVGASGTRTGGNYFTRPGNGTTVQGTWTGQSGGGTTRISWNATGLGLYTATPVAQAARVGQATNSTGVSPAGGDRTMVDVTTAAVADPAKVNSNFAIIAVNMWNLLETAVHNLGVTA